jgi:catechol 2,3-dioxygenase
MHLQVGDIPTAADFYHGILGFDITATMPSALFVSAGGYHHHIGMNIWHSRGAEPRPHGVAGLNFFTINFATAEARDATASRIAAAGIPTFVTPADEVIVKDPWQNTLVLFVGEVSSSRAAAGLVEAESAGSSLAERSAPTAQSENS